MNQHNRGSGQNKTTYRRRQYIPGSIFIRLATLDHPGAAAAFRYLSERKMSDGKYLIQASKRVQDALEEDLGETNAVEIYIPALNDDPIRKAQISVGGNLLPYDLSIDHSTGQISGKHAFVWFKRALQLQGIRKGEGVVTPKAQIIQALKLALFEGDICDGTDENDAGIIEVDMSEEGLEYRWKDHLDQPIYIGRGLSKDWRLPRKFESKKA